MLVAGVLSGAFFLAFEVATFRFLLLFFTALNTNFAIMLAVVLSGVALELGRSVDPQRVYVMVTTAMVGFMAMLAFPDPITKVILMVLTCA